ncbi:MAG TPA: HAMP domain-containing sensor histidine kinase [Thermoanaerobaculaceae bacterium]|nr:HAMP domain-containing sensor histidine kinase [Thermoanaerobaculaceae bacterium]
MSAWHPDGGAGGRRRLGHRLYHRVFASMLGFVLLALLLAALAGHLLLTELAGGFKAHLAELSRALAESFPDGGLSTEARQRRLETLAAQHRVQAALWSADGQRLAFTSTELPPPLAGVSHPHLLRAANGPAMAVPLGNGQVLVVQPHRVTRPVGFLLSVAALAVILALAAVPVARSLTRRLERLEAGVRRLGEGDLGTRVAVEGRDELASLASSFNRTAERLQNLVEAQRRVLASASHELRSPLARLRLALELGRDDPAAVRPRLDEAVAEVTELDALVEELLLAGRIELQGGIASPAPVDLARLVAEEAARAGASVTAEPVTVAGDERLLRALVRNLLDNARRHAGGTVEAGVEPLPAGARLWVADRGQGIAEEERERIFEPFHRPAGHAEGRDGGVGLGLYLVRLIARAHRGEATCRPREGGGTVFEVRVGVPA